MIFTCCERHHSFYSSIISLYWCYWLTKEKAINARKPCFTRFVGAGNKGNWSPAGRSSNIQNALTRRVWCFHLWPPTTRHHKRRGCFFPSAIQCHNSIAGELRRLSRPRDSSQHRHWQSRLHNDSQWRNHVKFAHFTTARRKLNEVIKYGDRASFPGKRASFRIPSFPQ